MNMMPKIDITEELKINEGKGFDIVYMVRTTFPRQEFKYKKATFKLLLSFSFEDYDIFNIPSKTVTVGEYNSLSEAELAVQKLTEFYKRKIEKNGLNYR